MSRITRQVVESPPPEGETAPRRGVVLLSVLVVVVVLTLAAYQYSEYMMAEYTAVYSYTKIAQGRALTDSGIAYVAAVLSDPNAYAETLASQPWNNPQAFQGILVHDDQAAGRRGRFSVLSLAGPDQLGTGGVAYVYGLTDEAGKINLNALLQLDSTGNTGQQMLKAMNLPGLTDEVIAAIFDWIDPDDTPRSGGAENETYAAMSPPYQCKNGPLDSLDELLLVQGVTPALLYGNDRNRNGVLDPDEDDGSGQINPGLQAYFTVYSRERNVDSQGNPRIFINDADLNNLSTNLGSLLSADMMQYILAARMYGSSSTSGSSSSGSGGSTSGDADDKSKTSGSSGSSSSQLNPSDLGAVQAQIQKDLPNYSGRRLKNIGSIFDLVNSQVSVKVQSGNTTKTVTFPSPLNSKDNQKQYLPVLLDKTTTTQNTDLPARINVNTAPQAVLQALPGIQDSDVQAILDNRPNSASGQTPDDIFLTAAWLLTEANISAKTLSSLDRFITARTQVYRFQVIGYFDGGGPVNRVEAVVDVNNGRPRIISYRDLTELGKAFDPQQMNGGQ